MMSSNRLQSATGFTLSEVLLMVGLIAICGSLLLHHFTYATEWAKGKMEKVHLEMLNDALELFKLEPTNEAVLIGKNDLAHNREVINALKKKGHVRFKKLLIERITSKGQGKGFIFTRYGDAQITMPEGELSKNESPSNFLKWVQSDCQEAWNAFKNQNPSGKDIRDPEDNLKDKRCMPPEALEMILNEVYFKR